MCPLSVLLNGGYRAQQHTTMTVTKQCGVSFMQAGSLTALDKGLSKMDDGKRKKLEEMVQEAAKARRPGAAAAAAGGVPAAAQAPVRASSNRSIRAPASVSI